MRKFFFFLLLLFPLILIAQADNEIQVYASPITEKGTTFIELHSNYTFKGMKGLPDPSSARYLNESLEITHGLGGNFELGFYVFTTLFPDGKYQYLGSHIRPRITVPEKCKWPFGASLSLEFGFVRANANSDFVWDGEIRPIIDKNFGAWYFSLNPNMDFVINGDDKHLGITPQFKTVYTIKEKVGVGIEYYSSLGTFKDILPGKQQEHLIGPMVDVYCWKDWEFNCGLLFGLTPGSNQTIFKLLLGHRYAKKTSK
jgi:hypothetical protein